MKVDKVWCLHCRRMFEPWTNEWYCSPACHVAAQRVGRAMADMIGLFELAASNDDFTEDEARVVTQAERAAHFPENPGTDEEET